MGAHPGALRARGTTVFLTTHYLDEADVLCDRLMIMDHGQIVAEGTPRVLKQQVAGDAILVSLRRDDQATAAAAAAAPGSRTSGSYAAEGSQIRLYVDDGGTALPQLIRLLDTADLGVRARISMSEPTLDDVFLRQTGRSLRDAGPDGSADGGAAQPGDRNAQPGSAEPGSAEPGSAQPGAAARPGSTQPDANEMAR